MNENYNTHAYAIRKLAEQFYFGIVAYDPIEQTYVEDFGRREWFRREKRAADMHFVVDRALRLAPAANLYNLVLEWPHIADTNSSRIAYTRNEADGERDRQTVTTAAKYLTRHFPTLPPHQVRDLTAVLGLQSFYLWETQDEIIRGVQEGPRSCMKWDSETEYEDHPYAVYTPAHGWRMAVRIDSGVIRGRCLCNVADDRKIFVRSYKSDEDGGYSYADEGLEAWLREQGFEKSHDWHGCKFHAIENPVNGGFLAPYLDGELKNVVLRASMGNRYFKIVTDSDGEFRCDNTDGTMDDINGRECECCGDRANEDDGIWIGYHGDTFIGECCADAYSSVYGRNGHEYYVHEDNIISTLEGEYYDVDYLSDNNIVALRNGDYTHIDNAVCIDDEWYHCDCDDVIFLEDTREHAIKDYGCWQCQESYNWYSDNIDPVEIDGDNYHPDSNTAQAHAEESDATDEAGAACEE